MAMNNNNQKLDIVDELFVLSVKSSDGISLSKDEVFNDFLLENRYMYTINAFYSSYLILWERVKFHDPIQSPKERWKRISIHLQQKKQLLFQPLIVPVFKRQTKKQLLFNLLSAGIG